MNTHLSSREQAKRYFGLRRHTGFPQGPVQTPAAWTGEQIRWALEQPGQEICYRLTAHDVAIFDSALDYALGLKKPVLELSPEDFPIGDLAAKFEDWRNVLRDGRGFVLIKGVPVDRWGTTRAETFFWCFGQHLGIPGLQNPQGDLLGHVTDTGDAAKDPMVRLYRTAANINYHCDGSDVVGLLCLRTADRGGASRIASSVTVFNELLRQEPELARRLCAEIRMDRRNEEREGELPWSLLQPACYDGRHLRTFYHSDYFRSVVRLVGPLPEEEQALLDAYEEIAERPDIRFEMQFEPGDIQLLSNHTVVHARTAYEDGARGQRHLLRLWITLQ